MPPWAHEGGSAALVARLKDPAQRARIQKEIENGIPGWYNHYTATGSWQGMLLVSLRNPEYKKFQGKRMSEVITALGGQPFDVFFQVLIDNGGSVPTVYFHHAEKDMQYALKQPFVSIGSDGGALKTEGPLAAGHPHPRYYGTFPRVLGRYVRDEKVHQPRGGDPQDDLRQHRQGAGLRPRPAAPRAVGRRHRVRPRHASSTRPPSKSPTSTPPAWSTSMVGGKVVLDRGKHTGPGPARSSTARATARQKCARPSSLTVPSPRWRGQPAGRPGRLPG